LLRWIIVDIVNIVIGVYVIVIVTIVTIVTIIVTICVVIIIVAVINVGISQLRDYFSVVDIVSVNIVDRVNKVFALINRYGFDYE